jgi:hypothetical protein
VKLRMLLVGAMLGLPLWATWTSPAAADQASAAFENVTDCLRDHDQLQVLAVVDESASLRRTDPASTRSTALETMVRNLAGVQQAEGEEGPRIEMKVSTFATDIRDMTDWTLLTEDTLPGLVQAADALAGRDGGLDTDFVAALDGARAILDARTAELAAEGVSVCQTLLWFTDGDYDLEPLARTVAYAPELPLDRPGNRERAMEVGRGLICDSSGIMDELHTAGVITLTVGLGLEITLDDERFLTQISEGSGGCGSFQRAGAGAYLSASDLDALLFAFDRASTGLIGGTLAGEDAVVPCVRDACASGSTTFELDASLDRFHLLVTAPEPLVVELAGPSGQGIVLDRSGATTASIDGAELRWSPLAGAFLVDGELPGTGDDWSGSWTVTFIDPSGDAGDVLGRSQVVLFGTLAPRLSSASELRLGESGMINLDIVDAAGSPRTPADLVGRTAIDITVTDTVSGREFVTDIGPPDAEGRRVATFDVDPATTATALRAEARLSVTTVGGLVLPERRDSITLPVLAPVTFPRIEPAALSLGPIAGSTPIVVELEVIGGEDDGCVWFGPSSVVGPRDLGTIEVLPAGGHENEEACLEVGAGESRTVEVTVGHDTAAGGTAEGSLAVMLSSTASDEVLSQDLPITIDFIRLVDGGRRLAIFLLVFGAGLFLPLIFLSVGSRLTARYHDPAFVRYATVSVAIGPDTLVRRGDDRHGTISFRPEEFRSIDAPAGDLKDVLLPGLRLGRRVPFWPLSPPVGTAMVDGHESVGSSGSRRTRSGHHGLVSFGLPSQWVLAVDPETVRGDDDEPTVSGRLWVFINEGTPYQLIKDAVEARLLREVPAIAFATDFSEPHSAPGPDDAGATGQGWSPPEDAERPGTWRPPTEPAASWTPPPEVRGTQIPPAPSPTRPFKLQDPQTGPEPAWRPPTD